MKETDRQDKSETAPGTFTIPNREIVFTFFVYAALSVMSILAMHTELFQVWERPEEFSTVVLNGIWRIEASKLGYAVLSLCFIIVVALTWQRPHGDHDRTSEDNQSWSTFTVASGVARIALLVAWAISVPPLLNTLLNLPERTSHMVNDVAVLMISVGLAAVIAAIAADGLPAAEVEKRLKEDKRERFLELTGIAKRRLPMYAGSTARAKIFFNALEGNVLRRWWLAPPSMLLTNGLVLWVTIAASANPTSSPYRALAYITFSVLLTVLVTYLYVVAIGNVLLTPRNLGAWLSSGWAAVLISVYLVVAALAALEENTGSVDTWVAATFFLAGVLPPIWVLGSAYSKTVKRLSSSPTIAFKATFLALRSTKSDKGSRMKATDIWIIG